MKQQRNRCLLRHRLEGIDDAFAVEVVVTSITLTPLGGHHEDVRARLIICRSRLNYTDVAKLERNRGHSTARNIAIAVGIDAGALFAIIFITIAHLD